MNRSGFIIRFCLAAILFGVTAASADQPKTITVMTHDSFSISKAVAARFEAENHVALKFLKAGDAGAALNQAILARGNPMADVFFGVDNTFLSRALKADIFQPYASGALEDIPAEFQIDPRHRLLPVDYGDVCLNYDKAWFADRELPPPSGLGDLIRPEYKGLTVVENPATSSPGLAFLLATVGHFGENGYLDYWKMLRNNQLLVTNGWKEAYWGKFSAASDGDRPIVVSYASSPPAEVYFSEKPLIDAPTAAVTSPGSCFRQIEFVGILKGTPNPDLARRLIDFMLGPVFQADIPLQMFVFPVNRTVSLPEVFVRHAEVAREPATVSPDAIDANRERWIEDWTGTVLR